MRSHLKLTLEEGIARLCLDEQKCDSTACIVVDKGI